TSIQGISDAMKNSASAFATLTEFTTQSGTDLDLYKKKLLDLNVAMTGKLATLGIQSGKSGTLIRNTITRLLSVTESAKKSFDNLGLTMDGTYLSFNRFSKEAGKNVYKAFDVLTSQLDKFKADGDILREMFTMRNWATILPMLQEMNGSTAEFVKNYVEGESALEGYNTQLKSLGNEVLVLKQSFTALMDGAITPFKDIMVGFISLLEKTIDSLKGLNESSKRFWSGLAVDITSTTVAISGLTFVAVGLFHLFKTVIAQETVKLLFNPITASLMILGVGMSTLYRHLKTLKKVEENRLENIKKLTKETKKFNEEIGTSERLTKKYQEELKKLEDVEINKTWINANADIENVIKSTEEYANIIKNMDTAFKINLDIKSPSQIREEKIAFEKKYSREGGQLGLEATPTLDAEKEFNILKRKKEKLDELMPLYKKYDESEKKIIELMHTYYKTKEQEVSYENAITDSRKLKLKIKELGGVENPDIKELEVQQKEYTKLVVEEIAKRKKAEEDYASKRATDLRTLQELFKTINTDINGVYAKDLATMYEINPEKYAKQYKAMYKEIFEYVDKYGTKIDENKKIKTITSSHFQEMATGLKQFGDLYKKETTIIQDTLSPKELEKLYGIAKLKGGVTLENREKFSKKTAEEIERIVEKYLELDTATKTSTETLRDNVAILKNTEKKAKEYAGALNIIATTTDKATGSNKKFSKSLSGLKDYDIKENLINPLERLKKNTELEKLAFDLDIIKEKLEEIDGVTSDNIGTKMKELLYKDGKLKTPTNGKWDKLTGKFKFNNEEDAIKWQETLDSIGMTTKQYEEFVALTIKEKETQEEIDKIKKEQADRQAELNKNAKELVENYGKTDLEIAQNKLQSLMGMREVSKDMLSTTLGLFMIDGKISDEELEKLQTMENILNLTEKQTEEYKQQYDIINQIKDTASVFGEMFGTDISSVVNPITDIFGDNGSLSKYKTADKASKNKNLSEADLQQAGKDKLMASADIATSVINSFDSV
ncbi:MAG: phage tail tape measure protein, partial [Bacteroidetes bacterium]